MTKFGKIVMQIAAVMCKLYSLPPPLPTKRKGNPDWSDLRFSQIFVYYSITPINLYSRMILWIYNWTQKLKFTLYDPYKTVNRKEALKFNNILQSKIWKVWRERRATSITKLERFGLRIKKGLNFYETFSRESFASFVFAIEFVILGAVSLQKKKKGKSAH